MAERNEQSGAHVKRSAQTEEPRPRRQTERGKASRDAARSHAPSRGRREERAKAASAEKTRRREDFEEYLAAAPAAPKKHRSRAKRRRAMRRLRTTLIVLFSLLLALVGGALYLGASVSNSATNLPNVYLRGIAVGGLDREHTEALLKAQGWEEESATPLTVTLPADVSFTVDRVKSGAVLSARKMAELAYSYGHSGNWMADLRSYLQSTANPVDMGEGKASLQDGYIREQVQTGLEAFGALSAERADYTVDKAAETLILYKGAGELRLNADDLRRAVSDALLAGETSLSYGSLEGTPSLPDFEAIYRELAVEPQDARYVEGTWEVVDEIVGCTFGVEQAVQLWSAADWMDEVRIPLTITYPEITGETLRELLFRDKLGSQTTYFPYSIPNRVSNINLAASKLNGIVLLPGQSLSYNETIGQRTLEAGFLLAGAYADGEVVEEIGGGICQVSSTLYCAEVLANLETVNRTNHYFRVDYLPIGFDATVSWPNPDFVFRNNRDFPVKIVAYCDTVERYITIEIWGTNADGTHVELRNNGVYTIYDTVYTDTAVGTATTTYRDLYDAEGNLISTTQERYSDYHKHAEDIIWPPEKYAADAAAESGEAEISFG